MGRAECRYALAALPIADIFVLRRRRRRVRGGRASIDRFDLGGCRWKISVRMRDRVRRRNGIGTAVGRSAGQSRIGGARRLRRIALGAGGAVGRGRLVLAAAGGEQKERESGGKGGSGHDVPDL